MELTIGSNRLRNTDGIICVRGSRQIFLEWGAFDSQLLLTMDLYGKGGGRLARLRRNHWTFNDNDRFDFRADARGINLVDTKSGHVVLEARVLGHDSVVITQGTFFSSAGHQIEITLEDWVGGLARGSSAEPATQPSDSRFSSEEVAAIRKAVVSSNATVACPRCGCPLTREHMTDTEQLDGLLVSCIICRRNLVVRNQS